MGRIYIFTGKGGVGKSSVAAAHAIQSAGEGVSTLLVSTDMAHNLGDIFETELGREPVNLAPNLDAYEIDPSHVMERDFAEMTTYLGQLLGDGNANNMEDFGMLPGMEELFSLLKIADLYKEGKYERILVDCAPTGETLSLLKFPELLSWYMEKFLPVEKIAVRVLAPVSKRLFKIEMPGREAMNDMERMYYKMAELQELLKDRSITSVRLVTMPEKMVVEETKRNYMYMNLYNFNVDGLYINRILPPELQNHFFDEWFEIQKKYVRELEDSFSAMPIYRIPWYDEELKGIEAVKRVCRDVLEKEPVFASKEVTGRECFEQNEKGYLLRISLPGITREELSEKYDIEMYQSHTDVVLKLGNFKRSIPLPASLRAYEITSARMEEGSLRIQFEKEEIKDE